jgi:hypothetical protein
MTGVVPRLIFLPPAYPAKAASSGYAAWMLPFPPGMPVRAPNRHGRVFHDHGLFTALFAGNNP